MILMLGATGRLGGQITRLLVERGHDVRAVVRSPEAADAVAEIGASPLHADLKDYESLVVAATGADTIVTTANAAARGGADTVESVDLDGNSNLIAAARWAGVRRFVFVSANGASPDSPVPLMRAKGITEQRLATSGLEWTVLAPEAFMDVWIAMVVAGPALAGREVVYVGSGRRVHSFVASADVARLVVAATEDATTTNERIVVGGPRPVSLHDAVGVFADLLGHSVAERGVAPGTPIEGIPEAVMPLLIGFDAFDSPVDMTGTTARFDVSLTPLEGWARTVVPVAAHA